MMDEICMAGMGNRETTRGPTGPDLWNVYILRTNLKDIRRKVSCNDRFVIQVLGSIHSWEAVSKYIYLLDRMAAAQGSTAWCPGNRGVERDLVSHPGRREASALSESSSDGTCTLGQAPRPLWMSPWTSAVD